MSNQKAKPATLTVEVADDIEHVHELGDFKDWGIIADNTILSITVGEDEVYYPLDSVRKWTVKAHVWKKKISHFYPQEVHSGVNSKAEESH